MKINKQYLAGVADSDGSFSFGKKYSNIRKKHYYCGQFQLTWKYSKECLEFMECMVKTFGGSFFDGITHTSFAKTRILKYCATGLACKKICEFTLPYLILKSKQCSLVLEGASLKLGKGKWGVKGKTKEVWEQENIIYEKMKILNTKNNKVGKTEDKLLDGI